MAQIPFLSSILLIFGLKIVDGNEKYSVKKVELLAEFGTLEYVHTVWRHGDRTPGLLLFPEDKAKWPQGVGELTEEGVAQQYRLGQWFRKRYGSWLGEDFNRNAIYIRSSDYNRTLMSALANMAGLFPPKRGIEPNLMWQPIPVHTMPKILDKELYEDISCPKADQEMEKQWKSGKAREILEEFKEEMDIFGKHLNWTNVELQNIWGVYDTFFCEKCHNIAWPSWLDSKLFDRLEQLYNQVSKLEFHTEVLRRLRGGTLLEEIFKRFTSKVDGSFGLEAKFYAYSAHDATIAALLSTFGIYYEIFPKYATALIIEMHKMQNSTRVLKLFHKNETDSETVFEYSIPGCSEPCTLEKLKEDLSRYFPDDWSKECGTHSSTKNQNFELTVLSICLSLTTFFLAVLLINEKKRSCRRLKYRKYRSENVQKKGGSKIRKKQEDMDDIIPMLSHSEEEEV